MGAPVKYPARQKYKPAEQKVEHVEEKPLSEEEHKARIEKLRAMGLIK
jgi:hypothetical protein